MHHLHILPMKRNRRPLAYVRELVAFSQLLAIAIAYQTGCASTPADDGGDPSANTGSLSAALTLPSGDTISTLNWVVTGPNGASTVVQQGTTAVQNSTTVTLLVGGLPAAANYEIALSGSSDGGSTCIGSLSFSVAARTTTGLSIPLSCAEATGDSGVLHVMGRAYPCAVVNGLWASPLQTSVGHDVTLVVSASGPDPGALTYLWDAAGGPLSAPFASSTTFTCRVAGSFLVEVEVSDGPVPVGAVCDQSSAGVRIQCSAPPEGGL